MLKKEGIPVTSGTSTSEGIPTSVLTLGAEETLTTAGPMAKAEKPIAA
jgi:hypothetical protein